MKLLIGFFVRTLSFVIFIMPAALRVFIGRALGEIWFSVLRIRRKVLFDNLARALPETNARERKRIARLSMHNIGQVIVEFFLFPYADHKRVRDMHIFRTEPFDLGFKKGKGVCILTLHLGNGDFAVTGLSRLGYKMNLITKEFRTRWLNDFWFELRKNVGTKLIGDRKSHFDILRALKKNEAVVFVLDQHMGPPLGVRTQFFGHTAGTAKGLASLVARTGSAVVPAYTIRLPDHRHEVVFGPEIVFEEKSSLDETIAHMTQVYTSWIEDVVRQHPDQWLWIHKRWKEFRD